MFTGQYHTEAVKSSTTSIDTDYISNTNCLTSHKCGKTITIYKLSIEYDRVSFMAYRFNVYIDSIGILSLFLGFDEISKNNCKT